MHNSEMWNEGEASFPDLEETPLVRTIGTINVNEEESWLNLPDPEVQQEPFPTKNDSPQGGGWWVDDWWGGGGMDLTEMQLCTVSVQQPQQHEETSPKITGSEFDLQCTRKDKRHGKSRLTVEELPESQEELSKLFCEYHHSLIYYTKMVAATYSKLNKKERQELLQKLRISETQARHSQSRALFDLF